MLFNDLNGDQARQTIDTEQVFRAYSSARAEFEGSYAGSIAWKTVRGRAYLYRKRRNAWKSLGPRSPATEAIDHAFRTGRVRAKDRLAGLARRLDEMAPVNRALRLGRAPVMAARIMRALADARLTVSAIEIVGTNALYAYERLAGVQIAGAHLATADVDLLLDARASLKLLAPDIAVTGLAGLLQRIDKSFVVMGRESFRAVNRDGYMVDLITPSPQNRLRTSERTRIGTDASDLNAVEIEGLVWLVNSPKVRAVVLDERGYPFEMVVPDPRAFALHKAWLAEREDREPLKRRRDAAQGRLVAGLVADRLPHLRFDDSALGAIPQALRARAATLTQFDIGASGPDLPLAPDW
ncbi:nucleotidyltransferase domain-containing protein [Methylobacterium durans]|uniref:nucleotidyltransferase domain-containing protein n=1 Tax=Methylobacterium durans TaxID=2202825 RepID=UPI002AFFF387|nr:nucleotidyltransferase domain-containing protein [Methylobacterium durans]MEA1831680.1 nucleotidyltransferase domain-containing protein [Methylobacterium durans]